MEKTEAVLDSDFLQGILKYSSGEFLKQLMDELNVRPVVHSYVAEVELQYCTEAQQLINSGYIRKVDYSEYLLTESDRVLYNETVWELLDLFDEKELPPPKYRDVFRPDFRYTEHSIGEILSELMAKYMRLPLFASNDGGAKRIAQAKINSARYTLKVKNLSELLQQVGSCENKLKWKDVKAVLREERWKKEKEKIHPLWNKTI